MRTNLRITDSVSFWLKQVSTRLRELSSIRDESAVLLNALAEQVEDFSVTLIDQVNKKEELSIDDEKHDTYASLLDEITEFAIRFSQKKVKVLYLLYLQNFRLSVKVHKQKTDCNLSFLGRRKCSDQVKSRT